MLTGAPLTEDEREWITTAANDQCWYIFGENGDKNLLALVPEAETFQKWNSICQQCGLSASFFEFGRICCRNCRQRRRKDDEDRMNKKGKNKRPRVEMDSGESNLCKKALNLSLNSDDGDKNRSDASKDDASTN